MENGNSTEPSGENWTPFEERSDTSLEDSRVGRRGFLQAAASGTVGVSATSQGVMARQADDNDSQGASSADNTTFREGQSEDDAIAIETIVVGVMLALMTVVYLMTRRENTEDRSKTKSLRTDWEHPEFESQLEEARNEYTDGSYARATESVQDAIEIAQAANSRAQQNDDDTTTITRALTTARDLKEDIVAERDAYEESVTNLSQIDQRLDDVQERVGAEDADSVADTLADIEATLEAVSGAVDQYEFDDLVIERDRLRDQLETIRLEILNQLARDGEFQPITVETEDLRVTKQVAEKETGGPSVVYEFTTRGDDLAEIRLVDTLPDGVEASDIDFLSESGRGHWHADGQRIVFEGKIDVDGSTGYELRSTAVTDLSAYLTEPTLDDADAR